MITRTPKPVVMRRRHVSRRFSKARGTPRLKTVHRKRSTTRICTRSNFPRRTIHGIGMRFSFVERRPTPLIRPGIPRQISEERVSRLNIDAFSGVRRAGNLATVFRTPAVIRIRPDETVILPTRRTTGNAQAPARPGKITGIGITGQPRRRTGRSRGNCAGTRHSFFPPIIIAASTAPPSNSSGNIEEEGTPMLAGI